MLGITVISRIVDTNGVLLFALDTGNSPTKGWDDANVLAPLFGGERNTYLAQAEAKFGADAFLGDRFDGRGVCQSGKEG